MPTVPHSARGLEHRGVKRRARARVRLWKYNIAITYFSARRIDVARDAKLVDILEVRPVISSQNPRNREVAQISTYDSNILV